MRVVMNEVEFLSKWGCLSVPKPWLQEKKIPRIQETLFLWFLKRVIKKKPTLYEEVCKRV
jgi:hypothetical protein